MDIFEWQSEQLRHPDGRAFGGEPCVVCGEAISPAAHPVQRDRHACSGHCNHLLLRRFKAKAKREGLAPPPPAPPAVSRAPLYFGTDLDAEFPYAILGTSPRLGDIVERHGSSTAYLPYVDESGTVVSDRVLVLHLNTGSFGLRELLPSGEINPRLVLGYRDPLGGRIHYRKPFEWEGNTWVWYDEIIRDVGLGDTEYTWSAPVCAHEETERMWTPAYSARSVRLRRTSVAQGRHLRRERVRRGTTGGPRIDPLQVFARDGWICQLCGQPIEATARWPDPLSASLDHRLPLAAGGLHELDNCQASHLRCNMSKGARIG